MLDAKQNGRVFYGSGAWVRLELNNIRITNGNARDSGGCAAGRCPLCRPSFACLLSLHSPAGAGRGEGCSVRPAAPRVLHALCWPVAGEEALGGMSALGL